MRLEMPSSFLRLSKLLIFRKADVGVERGAAFCHLPSAEDLSSSSRRRMWDGDADVAPLVAHLQPAHMKSNMNEKSSLAGFIFPDTRCHRMMRRRRLRAHV